MARYVDGFVVPVPRENVAAYRRMAQKAGQVSGASTARSNSWSASPTT